MFAKLSTIAALLSAASALTITKPGPWFIGNEVTVTWSSVSTDPSTFSLLLFSHDYGSSYVIASDVDTVAGSVFITVPDVMPGSYALSAVDVTDDDEIYAETANFPLI